MYASTLDAVDLERNQAIVEQQHVTHLDVLMQRIERDAHAVLAAVSKAERAVEEKCRTVRQVDAAILESQHTNFRTLQVAQQAYVPTAVVGRCAQGSRPLAMFIGTAMRKIQAGYVQPGPDHFA